MANAETTAPELSVRGASHRPTVLDIEDLLISLVESATVLSMVAQHVATNDTSAGHLDAVEWLSSYVECRAEEARAVLGSRSPRWLTRLDEERRHASLDRFAQDRHA